MSRKEGDVYQIPLNSKLSRDLKQTIRILRVMIEAIEGANIGVYVGMLLDEAIQQLHAGAGMNEAQIKKHISALVHEIIRTNVHKRKNPS